MGGNPGIMWGSRPPVVDSRTWNRVDVEVELMTAEAALGVVLRRLVYCGMLQTVHMAVGGGVGSARRVGTTSGGPPRTPSALSIMGHARRAGGGLAAWSRASLAGRGFRCGKALHCENECPDVSGTGRGVSGRGVDNQSCFS